MNSVKIIKSPYHRCRIWPENAKIVKLVKKIGFDTTGKPRFVIVCGGDGTFARIGAISDLPLLFVKNGYSVGNLAEISTNELEMGLTSIIEGNYYKLNMMKLKVKLNDSKVTAFNDIYITHSTGAGSIQYTIKCKDFEEIHTASGVIFSTPQGSSGYTKSAGGPVVHKDRIVITHIAPYEKIKLNGEITDASKYRWRILKPEKKIIFELMWPENAVVHCDGKTVGEIKKGKKIIVSKDSKYAKIIRFQKTPEYFNTVDAVIEDCKKNRILVVRRGCEPFKGKLALPGGHVEESETEEQAIHREVKEETGLDIELVGEFGQYWGPDRDPRGPSCSVVFAAKMVGGNLKAGDDARDAMWYPLIKLRPSDLAFDHWRILNDYFRWTGRILGGTLF